MKNDYSKKIISKSRQQTEELGYAYGKLLCGNETIALYGEAGAGKTVFVKGVAKALEIDAVITSPTFCIMNCYEGRFSLFHYDAYRIENADECFETDFFDNLSKGINIIEWAENIDRIMPKNFIKIYIDYIDANSRQIEIIE